MRAVQKGAQKRHQASCNKAVCRFERVSKSENLHVVVSTLLFTVSMPNFGGIRGAYIEEIQMHFIHDPCQNRYAVQGTQKALKAKRQAEKEEKESS